MAHRLAELAVAGAGGGVAFWTVALPLDFAKTRLQVGAEAGSASVAGVLLDAVRAGGLRRIYVGYASALARGVCFEAQAPSTSRSTLLGTWSSSQNRNDRLDFLWSGDLAIWR